MESCTTNPDFRSPGRRGATQPTPGRPVPGERLALQAAADLPAALGELAEEGFSPTEAGNLGAYLLGLGQTVNGWTIGEIEKLLFVRHLVSHQHIRS